MECVDVLPASSQIRLHIDCDFERYIGFCKEPSRSFPLMFYFTTNLVSIGIERYSSLVLSIRFFI
jgi:hypothetical protein